jgi:spermidine/putrescine transport system permease protein
MARGDRLKTSPVGRIYVSAHIVVLFLFLYAPIVILMILAFNDSAMTSFPFRGFTLEWFSVLAHDTKILIGLKYSFLAAISSTALSVIVGTATAYALIQYRFPGRLLCIVLIFVPIVIPKTVLGLSLVVLTTYFDIPRSLATLVFGHVLFCFPFVTIIVASVFLRLDKRLIEAAGDLGASEWRTFRKVVLPLISNGIIAGAFVAFILSFSEFNLSFFLSGREQTLPLVVFSEFRFEITPKINALSALMVVLSVALTVLAEMYRTGGFGRWRARETAATDSA